MEQKKNILILILAIVITAIVVGGGVYWWQMNKTVVVQDEIKTESTLYKNERYGISLEIPAKWGEVEIITETPEDPGPPKEEGKIIVPNEKVTFTSTNDPKRSFEINIFDTTTFKDYMTFADVATSQTVIYEDNRYIIDLWDIGIKNLFPCEMMPEKNIPKEVCDEEKEIFDEIHDQIISTFKMEL